MQIHYFVKKLLFLKLEILALDIEHYCATPRSTGLDNTMERSWEISMTASSQKWKRPSHVAWSFVIKSSTANSSKIFKMKNSAERGELLLAPPPVRQTDIIERQKK
jgi:hypothetical protein